MGEIQAEMKLQRNFYRAMGLQTALVNCVGLSFLAAMLNRLSQEPLRWRRYREQINQTALVQISKRAKGAGSTLQCNDCNGTPRRRRRELAGLALCK